jgi:calreticulin
MFKTVLVGAASVAAETYFKETFDASYTDRWVESDWKKGEQGKWAHSAGDFYGDAEADKGLQTTQDARFYGTSAAFPKFSNEGKDLVVQFSVKHAQKIDCGGGYVKLFPSTLEREHMTGDSDYNIMFGPDICGTSNKKVHVIFNYKGQNLLTKKSIACETDQLTHVYTLIVRPDNTYEVRIDGENKASGNLADDWDFLLPKEIKDPAQSKPEDWVDEAQIDDPEDVKPEGYDDIPKEIDDPDAEKPDDWDDEADGDWEAPTISNPEYKGEWKPKRIPNPAYKGEWVHPMIPNPDFVDDKELYKYSDFGALGFDLWQVKSGSIFDNIIITDDVAEAEALMAETYSKNKDAEKAMFDAAEAKKKEEEEAERKRLEEERKAAEEEEDDDDEEEEEDEAPVKEEL